MNRRTSADTSALQLESEKLSKAKEKHACDREALEMCIFMMISSVLRSTVNTCCTVSRAHREVIQAQVHINHHGACASKELIETQANNTSLEQGWYHLSHEGLCLTQFILSSNRGSSVQKAGTI